MKNGAVCFIDLLGFSYLTKKPSIKDNQIIIKRYIKVLHQSIDEAIAHKGIDFVVLSDSVFLFSENRVDDILIALSTIFRKCLVKGVLLRAGLAYGEYDYTETQLAKKNIYGKAVTKAVEYEGNGKGCRIFTDSEFPSNSQLFNQYSNIFEPYKNYANYSVLDVFEWPLINNDYIFKETELDTKRMPNENIRELLIENHKLSDYLQFSPLFEWNTRTEEGCTQVFSTIEYLTTIIDKILKATDIEEREMKQVAYLAKNQKRRDKIVKSLQSERFMQIVTNRSI